MKATALKKLPSGIAAVVLMLGLATTGRASIVIEQVGPPVMTGSWDLNFLASGDPFNTVSCSIASGGAFESPGMSAVGWVLTKDTSTDATISGASTTFLPFTTHFLGIPPAPGTVPPFLLGFEVFNSQNSLVGETVFAWTGSSLVVVPEPSTVIAGALLLLPFVPNVLRTFRRNRTA